MASLLWVLFAHGALAVDLLRAQPETVGMSSERLARIKPFMQRYIDANKLAGIVTLIARSGKVVHFEKSGKLNSDTGEETQKDSLFRIYSMTQPVVSVIAMMLLEEAKLLLNKPVASYLPAFKDTKLLVDGVEVPQSHPFTVRELMSHQAALTYGVCSNTPVDKQYQAAKSLGNKDLAERVSTLSKIP